MAKPIKETPILTGQDAREFVHHMKASSAHRVDASESARIQANFKKLSAIVKF